MTPFYPAIEPYRAGTLDVGDGHRLYWEECGRPDGIPVVFLHGGPGSGCEPWHRRFFDPARYRIVLFDQRGSGRSTPHAGLDANTTPHLVADIERLRTELGIKRWLAFGGSWGSTLGLAYAESHPGRVLGLILRGIFLCRPRDIAWFYQSGADRLFPEAWADYLEPIPEDERGDLVAAYHRRLTDADPAVRERVAQAWSVWEGRCSCLQPNPDVLAHFAAPAVAVSLARIECHYFINDSFLAPDQLLRDAGRLARIPGVIVHGRYDIVCPVEQAVALHHAWPAAELQIVPDAGHSAAEPGIAERLVAATDDFAARLA
ncbi:Proline iminopeptidase [Thioalkalivibrio nitratireducens DSM 14787]|uniref:Proline iminopeptidase n=1 Tax=Thioalkalivibrio nitratireducens (strain DSM 14787 / UNIQEM 213 / ALEN2) TaxID=1255043 RepID=L0E437_THIND|nr:prolyl aminopeptidase [Thioalkalivibrio nitratireducens]AGA35421.1 Proline iminopeptidase [Thioalkalivibrio nitratireducens DSM 14787]